MANCWDGSCGLQAKQDRNERDIGAMGQEDGSLDPGGGSKIWQGLDRRTVSVSKMWQGLDRRTVSVSTRVYDLGE